MPCGGPKKSPRTSSIVQIIFSFWSFEISEGILRNQKLFIGLDSFSKQGFYIIWFVWIILVFVSTSMLKVEKLQYFSLASFCQTKRVTEETFVVETAVWPIHFLINMLFALKGSQFIFICYYCSWCCAVWRP